MTKTASSTDRSLSDKAIKLKGKDYVLVVDRIKFFNEHFPNGSISTELVEVLSPESGTPIFVVRALVTPDSNSSQCFTGLSQAKLGASGANKEAALENAETSAVGRALAMMGIGVIDSIASVDEMKKAGVDLPF